MYLRTGSWFCILQFIQLYTCKSRESQLSCAKLMDANISTHSKKNLEIFITKCLTLV